MIAIDKKPLSVGNYVSTEHVDTVIKSYKKERWVHNSERIGKEDSLSGWWSIEEMEDYLEQAKMHGADGVKLYFGAYPSDYVEEPLYAGRQTLVMVATRQKECADGAIANKDIYVNRNNKPALIAYNRIQLCPPSCKKDTSLDIESPEIGVTIVDRGAGGFVVI
ncbi:hypothetical protein [Parasediminibacterium sp. JCM 36343]|uniref:hypothetical protein n=1 Tax=Parasediminibacterium sp. JCM 36343 TaxID=3374279 RepID=UPI00397E76AD